MTEEYGVESYSIKEHEQNERMLMHLRPHLSNLQDFLKRKIVFSQSDINLGTYNLREKLVSAMIQYLVNTNDTAKLKGMTRYFGVKSSKILSNLIAKIYPRYSTPEYPGSLINRLRRDAGVDSSYLEEVALQHNLEIGHKDITMDIRVPDEIDENQTRALGWLSTAHYNKSFVNYKGRKILHSENIGISFKMRDTPFVWYEFMPFFEAYHNYSPSIWFEKGKEFHGKISKGISIKIAGKSIISYYKNIGIVPNLQDRRILNHVNKNVFKAGLFDIWGGVRNKRGRPEFSIFLHSKFSTLVKQLQDEFGKGYKHTKNRTNPGYEIYLAYGDALLDFIDKYPIANPKLLYPIEYYRHFGKYPENVNTVLS